MDFADYADEEYADDGHADDDDYADENGCVDYGTIIHGFCSRFYVILEILVFFYRRWCIVVADVLDGCRKMVSGNVGGGSYILHMLTIGI